MHVFIAAFAATFAIASASPAAPTPAPVVAPTSAEQFASTAIVDVDARPLPPQIAPADQYFGRLKLSNLGMRNIIHALSVEGTSPLALPMERTRIMGVDTAIVEWADDFPHDPWLKRVVLNFADVLARKHDVDTDRIAIGLLLQVSQHFRNTPYEKLALSRANALSPTSDIDWSVVPFDPPSYMDLLDINVKNLR
jgi:hypothetical protein